MNSSELSADFQSSVVTFHYYCGAILGSFNMMTCVLILWDTDSRGKSYRKYLFFQQFFSTLADLWMDAYTPFFQVNCRVLYADSALSKIINFSFFLMSYVFIFMQISFAYFACVYYRRNVSSEPK
ncbi:hypothetical protein PENTCL1PPCAC_5151, partial [Pristionchus entomophagus]